MVKLIYDWFGSRFLVNSDPDLEEAVWFLTRLEKVRAAGRMLCSRAAFRETSADREQTVADTEALEPDVVDPPRTEENVAGIFIALCLFSNIGLFRGSCF